MIEAAEKAYATRRSPARWDGVPWGECGRANHRAAIKAALRAGFKESKLPGRMFRTNEWVTAWVPEVGTVTGNMRMCKGQWHFFGDVLRDIKWSLRSIKRKGGSIQTHRVP
jgi:hypothetical protein